jgi:hypothetical protein
MQTAFPSRATRMTHLKRADDVLANQRALSLQRS